MYYSPSQPITHNHHHTTYHEKCNNCHSTEHTYKFCKAPITSCGVVLFRHRPQIEYLMIRRRDTLGFVDFMRGKYSVHEHFYVGNMIRQMTKKERQNILEMDFDSLWCQLWNVSPQELWANRDRDRDRDRLPTVQYRQEDLNARTKFMTLKESGVLETLISQYNADPNTCWDEPEWGFPKGRRNFQEKDYECALREMCEETGYSTRYLTNVSNLMPFEEVFTGSNYKSYKHKYYVLYFPHWISTSTSKPPKFDQGEVSAMQWMSFDECMAKIRPYNYEKKEMLQNIHKTLGKYTLCG